MRFLIFNSQAAALAAVAAIDENGRALFQARGYTITQQGDVVGRRLSDGSSAVYCQTMATWDIPRQRLDGAWIVSHPENAMHGSLVVTEGGATAAEVVLIGVTATAIEEYSSAWFPPPTRPGS